MHGASFLNRVRNWRCNHRSGHLKTEHTESLFLLRRHLGNWPRSPAVSTSERTAGSAWETWTVSAAKGVRCARVRWEINFLLTFETAPFICKHPVYIYIYQIPSYLQSAIIKYLQGDFPLDHINRCVCLCAFCRWQRACTWSDSLSHSFNIAALLIYFCQFYVF